MTAKEAAYKALEASPLFSCCEPGQVEYTLKSFSKGSNAPNTPGGDMAVGLITRGRVQVYSICEDGTTVNLSSLNPGDCFGISNLFNEDEMATTLICDTKTSIAYISKDHFLNLLSMYPEVLMRYASLCNNKINYLIKKIGLLTMSSCRARLAGYLLRSRDGDTVHLGVSKERLAAVLGVSRASLFRELRWLSESALIRADGKDISLLNVKGLEKIVNQL